jgi:hypothetical protein
VQRKTPDKFLVGKSHLFFYRTAFLILVGESHRVFINRFDAVVAEVAMEQEKQLHRLRFCLRF